jgi:DNA invertase Pin-like site-specific DNA recombinase
VQVSRVAQASSEGQGASAGRQAQRRALAAACRRRGWQPRARAEGTALVASKRERLASALPELVALLASAQKQGWTLVALECTLSPPEPAGEASASLLATFAPCEQHSISQRTRAALARTRSQGVRLGRPPTMSPYAIERIRTERAAGKSLAAIANGLNADRIPTAQGGRRWYPATIRHTLKRTS